MVTSNTRAILILFRAGRGPHPCSADYSDPGRDVHALPGLFGCFAGVLMLESSIIHDELKGESELLIIIIIFEEFQRLLPLPSKENKHDRIDVGLDPMGYSRKRGWSFTQTTCAVRG